MVPMGSVFQHCTHVLCSDGSAPDSSYREGRSEGECCQFDGGLAQDELGSGVDYGLAGLAVLHHRRAEGTVMDDYDDQEDEEEGE